MRIILSENELKTYIRQIVNENLGSEYSDYIISQLRNIPTGTTGPINFYGYKQYDFEFEAKAMEENAYAIRMTYPATGRPQSVTGSNAVSAILGMCDDYIRRNSPSGYLNEIYDASKDEENDEQYVIFDKNSHKMLHWGSREDCRNMYDHTESYKNNKDIRVMRATDARKLTKSKADVTDKTTDRNDGHR